MFTIHYCWTSLPCKHTFGTHYDIMHNINRLDCALTLFVLTLIPKQDTCYCCQITKATPTSPEEVSVPPAGFLTALCARRLPKPGQQGDCGHLLQHKADEADLCFLGSWEEERVCWGGRGWWGWGGRGRQGGGRGAEALVFWCAGLPGGKGPRPGPWVEQCFQYTGWRQRTEPGIQRWQRCQMYLFLQMKRFFFISPSSNKRLVFISFLSFK